MFLDRTFLSLLAAGLLTYAISVTIDQRWYRFIPGEDRVGSRLEEMMEIVFRVKRFFDVNFVMVLVSTLLFLVLVILLSLRIRQREFQTLHKIGCAASTVLAMQAAEVVLIVSASTAVASLLVGVVFWYVVRFGVLL